MSESKSESKTSDFYTENYKSMMKEVKEDADEWKDILCSWGRRLNIVKMSILPKEIYKSNTILSKPQWQFFCRNIRIHPKIHVKSLGISSSQNNLEKVQSRRILFQNTLQSYSNQNSVVAAKRQIDQWNRIKSPETNPHIFGK